MAKWILDQYTGPELDYPSLGFRADPGEILDATAAPDARWSRHSDQAAAETVTRYTIGYDPNYVEPTDGHVLTWDETDNAYVPTAPVVALREDLDPAMTSVLGSGGTFDAELDARVGAHAEVVSRVKITEAPLSPLRYGFVGDGVADDTVALQDSLNALPVGGEMVLPHSGNAKITAPLSITKPLTIQGRHRESQRILAVGCDGINVTAGVDGVRLRDFEIAAGTRYSTTANTFVGVNVDGTAADNPTEHLYENVFCDGFHTAFRTRYLWSSRFEGVRTAFGLIGIDAYGKSVNNFVGAGTRLTVEKVAGSRGVRLYGRESFTDAAVVASEGWLLGHMLTYGAEIGVDCVGVNHVYLGRVVLDFCQLIGLRAIHNGTAFANNVGLTNSYIGMDGAAGDAAVKLANTVSHTQRRAARIIGNEFTVYSDKVAARAVHISGSEARAIVEGNTSTFFSTRDIEAASPDNIIRGNECLSAVTYNIYSTVANLVADNVGTVFRPATGPETQGYRRDSLGRKVTSGTAAPTAGTWAVGDRVAQAVPAVGSPKGWLCTVAGTPGTWVSEGNL